MIRMLLSSITLALLVAQPVLALTANKNSSTADHSKFEQLKGPFKTGPDVTKACLECHTEAAKEIHDTLHWTWKFDKGFGDETLGKITTHNNFCISIASNEPRCTSCHIGYGMKDSKTFDFTIEENVDCLVCHDTSLSYSKFPTDAGHPNYVPKEWPTGSGKIRPPIDLAKAAQSVGTPKRENCGSCHFYGGGGDGVKHGDLDSSLKNPHKGLDVHMSPDGASFQCQDCHTTSGHQTAGSRYVVNAKDTDGIDVPGHGDQVRASCESCHSAEPHDNGPMAERLNHHATTLACSTCHVPEYARERKTKTGWDWSTAGDKSKKTTKDDEGYITFTPKKGNFTWERNVVPDYDCFNGNIDYTTVGEKITPDADGVIRLTKLQGDCGDKDARIWPFKIMRSVNPYDPNEQVMITPHLFGKDKNALWKNYDWDKAIKAGMETSGLNYSGEVDFVKTEYHFPIVHMVAPKEEALRCHDCHAEDGRMKKLSGFYIAGQTKEPLLDTIGWLLVLLTALGVLGHALVRIIMSSKRK